MSFAEIEKVLNNLKYFFILYICLITSSQAEITLRQYNDRYCYDGDTCYVTVDGTNTKIRLLELDTPEISKPKCEQELEWGLRARDFINNRIENAQTIEFKTNYKLDWFGRTLSYLIIDGEDISAELVRNNLGVVYKKGFKVDWCQEHVN
jgi:endonuclease YncB( thermonuclease family)